MEALPPPPIGVAPIEHLPARVYLQFYGLNQAPFSITPDPEFLFAAGKHQQAVEKIIYSINTFLGFILLTGEVGTGKTTLCRTLLDQLSDKAETVYIINPSVSGQELLTGILEDAHIAVEATASKKALIDRLHEHLLSRNQQRPFVVIIDDAQTMPPETLEDLRLLSNLETDKHKLIQVVLSGQPELIDHLGSTGLRQLKQRIATHCHLSALSAEETDAYIAQRLFVAGNQGQVCFANDAKRRVYKASRGIPRLINKVCDYALIAGYVEDAQIINGQHVRKALFELQGFDSGPSTNSARRLVWPVAIIFIVLLAIVGAFFIIPGSVYHLLYPVAGVLMAENSDLETTRSSGGTNPLPDGPLPSVEKARICFAPTEASLSVKNSKKTDENLRDPVTRQTPSPETAATSSESPRPLPYAMQLGSFRTRKNAEQSVFQHQEKGIPAHWQAVNSGQWYRVVAGKFQDLKTARQYKSDHRLKTALIIHAPLTVKVAPGQRPLSTTEIPDFLSKMGHGCLMETGSTGDKQFYTGLFAASEDAALIAEKVNASNRFVASVVNR